MRKKGKKKNINKNIFKSQLGRFVISLILSVSIIVIINNVQNSKNTKTTSVIVSTKEIKAGEKITSEMITTVKISGTIPSNFVSDSQSVVGEYAKVNITANDVLTKEKLSSEAIYGSSYLENLGEDERAISITINSSAIGVSGKLESGDIVSVISNFENDYGTNVSKIVDELRYIEIISVNDSNGGDVQSTTSGNTSTIGDTITLLVNEKQALILANLEFSGDIHLALVYRGNDEYKQFLLNKQVEILKEIYPESYIIEEELKDVEISEELVEVELTENVSKEVEETEEIEEITEETEEQALEENAEDE